MRARAPGKLVLSGAYVVLRGAPALVSAVDRYVIADGSAVSEFKTPEVQAALDLLGRPSAPHPAFDASELRTDGRKLGLGSSAAIVVASVLSLLEPDDAEFEAREHAYELCRRAHRSAQGGGSGIDVAASFFGGTLRAELRDGELMVAPVELPLGLLFEIWALPDSATTADFVERVFEAERREAPGFREAFDAQTAAAYDAALSILAGDGPGWIAALRRQLDALDALGRAAGVPIVLPDARKLHDSLPDDACFLPAGAGGGDISIYVGTAPSSPQFRSAAEALRLERLPLSLGAPGASLIL